MDIFPTKYIHLVGDEAAKTNWEKCPKCQQRIKDENLPCEEELQGYFMARMNNYLKSKGRVMLGWDEVTNSTIPEDAIIYGWQGMGNAALVAANKGHKFVMTPARVLYLIRYQGPQWFEPLTYFGNNTLNDVYNYEPVQESWNDSVKSLLWGVQASLWTEFCESDEDAEYLIFPRLMALAETGWCPQDSKDWNGFQTRLDAFLPRLEAANINYARPMFNIQHIVNYNSDLSLNLD